MTLGGSSTNDGGIGMAIAMGVKAYDKYGNRFIATGGTLDKIAKLDFSNLDSRIKGLNFTAMCDVKNTVCGENGASAIFGRQKGAKDCDIKILDDGLNNLFECVKNTLGIDCFDIKGGGAAGGLGAGVCAYLNGKLVSGIDYVLDYIGFENEIRDADLIITGEGKLDNQSFMGKVIGGVCNRAENKKIAVVCGLSEITDTGDLPIDYIIETNPERKPFGYVMHNAKRMLSDAVKSIF